ncbi:histidine kinase [Kitasatospora sp. NBC_01560]|uniref:sensor histidine kinase n=1 Tax=Kitasatospora sp. NBC_01560 TaxID=2975965 RepID=UPI0038687CBC
MNDSWLRRTRRRHPRLFDTVGGLALLAVTCLGTMIEQPGRYVRPDVLPFTLAVLSSLVVLAHRRYPRTVTGVTLGCALLFELTSARPSPTLSAPLLTALYFLAVRTDRLTARVATAVAGVLLTITALVVDSGAPLGERIGILTWVVLPGAIGDSIRNRRAHLAAIEERAERAERTREEEARHRVADERIRIARDLHDVVAHHIALANAQAGIAVHLLDTHPAQAREMLSHLTDATGSALQELRATVGLLRRADDPEAPLEPAPGLGRLPELINSFERAGLPVRLTVEGEPRPLSAGVDLTAYRILQESLTNVAKHARGAGADVTLVYSGSRVALSVANGRPRPARAPHPAGPAAPPRPATPPRPAAPSRPADAAGYGLLGMRERAGAVGYGLLGMRERAGAVGGRLSADPRPGGGFLVTAELPLRTAAAREDKDHA